ncbi:hypothetical protein [Pontibacter rugosus]|uniref:Uncharacterized protein n=1 Tax=Pontibacter rugosus TaxID=1745966 RepID=A0ABW3SLP5_9BACT
MRRIRLFFRNLRLLASTDLSAQQFTSNSEVGYWLDKEKTLVREIEEIQHARKARAYMPELEARREKLLNKFLLEGGE